MKLTKYLAAAAMAMLAIGCAKEQVGSETPDGQEINVTFKASLPDGIQTRAIGDGTTANTLIVAVYDEAGNELSSIRKTEPINISTTVEFSLVKGKTYNFIFWAQAGGDKNGNAYYTLTDMKNIVINYNGDANNEDRDAFFAIREGLKVTGAMSETVELHRPFSQVNFGTTDFDAAEAAGFVPTKSSFTATEAATVFCPFENEGKTGTSVSYTANNLPNEELKVKIGDAENTYKWMAMNYFIPVGTIGEKQVSDVTATFTDGTQEVTISAPNAPVRSNYRTNILGSLLTDQTIFNVIIDPVFKDVETTDPDYSDSPDYIYNKLSLTFANGGVVTLTKDVELTKGLVVPAGKSVVLDLGGNTISNTKDIWDESSSPKTVSLIAVDGGTLTIKGAGKIKAKENDCYVFNVKDNGKLIIEDGEFVGNVSVVQVQEGSAEIKGGKFSLAQKWPSVGNGSEYLINLVDAARDAGTASAIVYGGTFENFDPSNNLAEGANTNFVAPGYKSTKISTDPDVYTVTKADISSQEGLNNAIKDAAKGQPATVVLPSNSTITLDNGIANEGDKSRDLTFVGDGTQTFDVVTKAVGAEGGKLNYQRGSSFTFKNMTIQAGEGNFDGIVCDELTYENCTIKGKLTLYGKATFVNCTFENDMANQYSIWTWGGTDVKFDGCEFNTNGKAILLYGQATAEKPTNLTVSNCIFNDRNNGSAGKAAIEIGNDYNATYTLNISGCTVNGFADGKNTGSKIWANKNSMDAAHLSVTIDGTKVL